MANSVEQQLLNMHYELMAKMNELIDTVGYNQKAWYTAEECLKMFGLPPTERAKRKLKWLRDRNLLVTFVNTRPYIYQGDEVRAVADRIKQGTLVFPTI